MTLWTNNPQKKEEMIKLRAIWEILFAQKIAVFTWKDDAPNPLWLTVPTFNCILSDNWNDVDLVYIKQKVKDIINSKKNG